MDEKRDQATYAYRWRRIAYEGDRGLTWNDLASVALTIILIAAGVAMMIAINFIHNS